jgi:5,10-methenyltetrahydrofolate synthetase
MDQDPKTRQEIMAWRREQRQRLLDERVRMPVAYRQQASTRISGQLDALWRAQGRLLPGVVLSAFWPLRGEPDLRPWLGSLHEQGLICVLPVVVEKAAPLQFRRWFPGCAMEKGFWNIPVPADPVPYTPQLLIGPLVGFDRQCYRLGYGGGYFDRTLAQLLEQDRTFNVVGVGYAAAEIPSIRPLPHDIPFQGVVTEQETITPAHGSRTLD